MTKPKIALVAQPLNIVVPPFQTSIGLWIYEVAQCLRDACNLVVHIRRNRLQPKTKGGRSLVYRQLRAFYGGSYVAYLKALSHRLDLNEQISFTGFLSSREALIERFQQASLVVMPSVWPETFGIPLVEAMASGVPVIASRVGGMVEVVDDEKTGLMVEPNDPAALPHAISRLLSNPSLRKVMGRAGREKVERQFTWARIGENLLKHYQELCGRTEN